MYVNSYVNYYIRVMPEVKFYLEKRKDKKTGKIVVAIDPSYFRPTEVDLLIGDAFKAAKVLKWKPKTDFNTLVKLMVAADLEQSNQ